jgi:antitoxin ParD1/3/4
MPLREVELDDDSEAIIADQIASGRYTTPSEVLKAGLEALERDLIDDDVWLTRLKAAAQMGFDQIERGEYVTLNSEQDIHELMDGILAEVMKGRHEGAAGA